MELKIDPKLNVTQFDMSQISSIGQFDQNTFNQNWQLKPAALGTYAFVLVTDGTITLCLDEDDYRMQAGDLLLIQPEHIYDSERAPHAEFSCQWAHFSLTGGDKRTSAPALAWDLAAEASTEITSEALLKTPYSRSTTVSLPSLTHTAGSYTEIKHLFTRALHEHVNPDYASSVRIRSLICDILLLATRAFVHTLQQSSHKGTLSSLTRTALHIIRAHHSTPLHVNELAAKLRITPHHLIRLFKAELDTTPLKTIQQVHLDHARSLLTNPTLSIKEVAYASGFKTQQHFTRLFTQAEGCSPGVWRTSTTGL